MEKNPDRDVVALYAQLGAALALADELDLSIVAIHIDAARTALANSRDVGVAAAVGGTMPASPLDH